MPPPMPIILPMMATIIENNKTTILLNRIGIIFIFLTYCEGIYFHFYIKARPFVKSKNSNFYCIFLIYISMDCSVVTSSPLQAESFLFHRGMAYTNMGTTPKYPCRGQPLLKRNFPPVQW